jgi:prepilin-type processing-associated H-X9-DG protein
MGWSYLDDVQGITGAGSLIYLTEVHYQALWTQFDFHDVFQEAQLWNGAVPRMSNDTRHGEVIPAGYFDGHAATPYRVDIDVESFQIKP